MGCLYRITSPSGKSYIGITLLTAEERFKKHCSGAKSGLKKLLSKAINKYGESNMKVETLAIANDWDYLCLIEKKAIEVYNTYKHGYNCTKGGEGAYGLKFSDEVIAKMSETRKGRANTEEQKNKISLALKGRKKSLSHAQNIAKGKKNANFKHSEETKQLISLVQKGKKRSEEFCEKIRQARTGCKMSEETKRKISEKARLRAVSKDNHGG